MSGFCRWSELVARWSLAVLACFACMIALACQGTLNASAGVEGEARLGPTGGAGTSSAPPGTSAADDPASPPRTGEPTDDPAMPGGPRIDGPQTGDPALPNDLADPDDPQLPPFPAPREGSYLPETPLFDLAVAEAAINALRPGRGTAALPVPPMQPQGELVELSVASADALADAANAGSADITLTSDVGFARIDRARDVLIRLDGHIIDTLHLTHFEEPTAAQRVKILGPGGIGTLYGVDLHGGMPSDITFEGVWFDGTLKSQPDGSDHNFAAERAAFLYCIGRGYGAGNGNGAWGIFAPFDAESRAATDIVVYGSNVGADIDGEGDGDNWAVRAAGIHRYWVVDSRFQADSFRQANRFYDLHDSVPAYTTPENVGTPRQSTFVNTYHGHALASVGTNINYNRGVFGKDFAVVSAQRGGNVAGTLFGPHPQYDEGTWVFEGMTVITDDGNINAEMVAGIENTAGLGGHQEDFELDFTAGGSANRYTADPSLVDPYAEQSNWPMVVSPNAGYIGSSPYDDPPWR